MNETAMASTRTVTTIRWIARVLAILLVTAFLFLFAAECIHKGKIAIENDRILMSVFLLLAFIGLIIAWKWELIGGASALVCLAAYTFLAPGSTPKAGVLFVTGMYGLPALSSGVQ